jgi:hypothetical protein
VPCSPLLEAANKDLFVSNAFRITGLPVEASAREIAKHADKLRLMEELGRGATAHTGAFALKPPPTLDQIRDATRKLNDPQHRLIDELFWFWPEHLGQSKSDPALQALAAGDSDTALGIWNGKEADPAYGSIATHNVAVLWHITALEREAHSGQPATDSALLGQLENHWRTALKRWDYLLDDDRLWQHVAERARSIDPDRLSSGFVHRMRSTLPLALAKINAEMALFHAENSNAAFAAMHARLVRERPDGPAVLEKAADIVLEPPVSRLRESIRLTKQTTNDNPEAAPKAVRELLAQAVTLPEIFDLLYGEAEHPAKEILDEAATTCVSCAVSHQKKTHDNRTFVDLLQRTLPLAQAPDVRRRIEENIRIGQDNLAFTELDPLYASLKAIQDSSVQPGKKLSRVRLEILPSLGDVKQRHGTSSRIAKQFSDNIAIVLRDISLDAWNKHQDKPTAVAAGSLALELAHDAQLIQKLREDQATIAKLRSPLGDKGGEHLRMQRGSYDSGMYVLFAFIAQLVITGVLFVSFTQNILKLSLDDTATWITGGAAGLGISLLFFWDRWKCNEAFSSQACSGIANLSMLYVPIVSLCYANIRAFKKVFDRKEWQDTKVNKAARAAIVAATIVSVLGMFGATSSPTTSPAATQVATPAPRTRPTHSQPPSPAYTPPPAPLFTPPSESAQPVTFPSTPSVSGNQRYRVSRSASLELDSLDQQITTAKAKSRQLENLLATAKQALEAQREIVEDQQSRIETLGRSIELDRISLDRSSQFAVDTFNDDVNTYNALLRKHRTEVAAEKELVDSYNSTLQLLKAQNRVVNSLVDDYNQKLRTNPR